VVLRRRSLAAVAAVASPQVASRARGLQFLRVKIVIYQKPTCTTCRQVHAALKESGVDFEAVDYYLDPIPKARLKELLRKMGMKPRELLRTKEAIYKELKLGERDLSDSQLIDLMVEHPDLIQRPIVEKGARAILARPAERLKEIL
jgi:arsenate reductase (glutaredoxin)